MHAHGLAAHRQTAHRLAAHRQAARGQSARRPPAHRLAAQAPTLPLLLLLAALPCTCPQVLGLRASQVPLALLPTLNLTWAPTASPWAAALVTTTSAPFLVQEDFSAYPLGLQWTAPGPRPGTPWTVEEASLTDPLLSLTFSPAGYLTIASSNAAVCTDLWAGTRAPAPLGCTPAPILYHDAPLRGSWQAEVRLAAPVSSVSGSMQCGLTLFSRQNAALPPFTAANPNINNQILTLVANHVAPGSALLIFENPGGIGYSTYSRVASGTLAWPYYSLMLQYDHVARVYSAFYRPSATAAYTFLSAITQAQVPNTFSNPRLGLYAKAWVAGRTWSCAIDYVSIQALPNAPHSAPWPAGVAQNVSARSAAAGASASVVLASDPAVAPGGAGLLLPLEAPGAFLGVGVALLPAGALANASAAAAAAAAAAFAAAAPPVLLLPYAYPQQPPPSTAAAPPASCASAASALLGAPDAALLRFHSDYTSLGDAPFLVSTPFALAGPYYGPVLAPALQDCALGHLSLTYAADQSPSGQALAWRGLSSFSTMTSYPAIATRRWIDINTIAVAAPSPYDSSASGSHSFFDPLDTGFDLFLVLRPAPGSAVDTQAMSSNGDPGSSGWTLNVLPSAAGVYFAAADNASTCVAGAHYPFPISTATPTLVQVSISANASHTGYPAGSRRVMLWVNGQNASTAPGLHPGSGAWVPSAWSAPTARFNCGGPGPDAVTGHITAKRGAGTQWWARMGAGLGGGTNNVVLSALYAWRGDIFQALLFRGSSASPSLSEAGRLALTAALLAKYRIACPALGGGASGAAPAPGSACSSGVEGSACHELCPPGTVHSRGVHNKTCSGGAWSGAPLVCVPAAAAPGAVAPAPPPASAAAAAAPLCVTPGAALPAFYAECSIGVLSESFASPDRLAAWSMVSTHPLQGGGDVGRAAVGGWSVGGGGGGGGGGSVSAALPLGIAPYTPASALNASASPPLTALVTTGGQWAAAALAGGPGAVTLSVGAWRPLRGSSGLAFAWLNASHHLRLRGAALRASASPPMLPTDSPAAPLAWTLALGCSVALESVVGGVVRLLGAAPCALAPGAAAPLSVTFTPMLARYSGGAGGAGGAPYLTVALNGTLLLNVSQAALPAALFASASSLGGVGLVVVGAGSQGEFGGPLRVAVACPPGAQSVPMGVLGGQTLTLGCPPGWTASGLPTSTVCSSNSSSSSGSSGSGGSVAGVTPFGTGAVPFDCAPPALPWAAGAASPLAFTVPHNATPGAAIGPPLATLLRAPTAHQVLLWTLVRGGAGGEFVVGNCSGQLRVGGGGLALASPLPLPRTYQLGLTLGLNLGASAPFSVTVNVTVLAPPPAARAASYALASAAAPAGSLRAHVLSSTPTGAPLTLPLGAALLPAGAAADGSAAAAHAVSFSLSQPAQWPRAPASPATPAGPPPTGVRYLRYLNTGPAIGPIALVELAAHSAASGANVAAGAPASATSAHAAGAPLATLVDALAAPRAPPFLTAGSGAAEHVQVDLGAAFAGSGVALGRVSVTLAGEASVVNASALGVALGVLGGAALWSPVAPNVNSVWASCPAAGVAQMGPFADMAACQAACQASLLCTSWTWHNGSAAVGAQWLGQCCMRGDAPSAAAPLPAVPHAGVFSQNRSAAALLAATPALLPAAHVNASNWGALAMGTSYVAGQCPTAGAVVNIGAVGHWGVCQAACQFEATCNAWTWHPLAAGSSVSGHCCLRTDWGRSTAALPGGASQARAGPSAAQLQPASPGWASSLGAGDTLQLLSSSGVLLASVNLTGAVNQTFTWAPAPGAALFAVNASSGVVTLAGCCLQPGASYSVNVSGAVAGGAPPLPPLALTLVAVPGSPWEASASVGALAVARAQLPPSAPGAPYLPPALNLTWGAASEGLALAASADASLVAEDFDGPAYPPGSALSSTGLKQRGWNVEEGSAIDALTNTLRFEGSDWATLYLHAWGAQCTDYWAGVRAPALGSGVCAAPPMLYQNLPLVGSWSAQLRLLGPTRYFTATNFNMQCGVVLFAATNVNSGLPGSGPFTSPANPNTNNMWLQVGMDTSHYGGPATVLLNSPSPSYQFTGPPLYPAGAPLSTAIRIDYDHRTGTFSFFYAPSNSSAPVTGPLAGPWTLLTRVSDTVGGKLAPFDTLRLGFYAKGWSAQRMACSLDSFHLRAVANTPLRPWTPPGYAGTPAELPPAPALAVAAPDASASAGALLPLLPDTMWRLSAAPSGLAGGQGAAQPLDFPNCSAAYVTPNFDRGGFDLGGVLEPGGLSGCIARCCSWGMCFGFAYITAAPGPFGTCTAGAPCCYLKKFGSVQAASPYVTPGVMWSGILLPRATSGAVSVTPTNPSTAPAYAASLPGTPNVAPLPSAPTCMPPVLSLNATLALDAAALTYHADFSSQLVRHAAPAGAGYAPASFWTECVGGAAAPFVSYTFAGSPGASTYAWLHYSALDTSAVPAGAPGRWMDAVTVTRAQNPAARAHFLGLTPGASIAGQHGVLDPLGYAWDFVAVLSVPSGAFAASASPMVAYSKGGEPGSCGWALGAHALPGGGAGVFAYVAGDDGAARAGASWALPLQPGIPHVVHLSVRYDAGGTAVGLGAPGTPAPVASCTPLSAAAAAAGGALPLTPDADLSSAVAPFLVAYAEAGGLGACSAACCAHVACALYTYASSASAGSVAGGWTGCAAGQPCCVLRAAAAPALPPPALPPPTLAAPGYPGGIWAGGVARPPALQCVNATLLGPSTDAPGNDLGSHSTRGGFGACQAACCAHPRCVFIVFIPVVPAGGLGPTCPAGASCCWLKHGAPAYVTNTAFLGAAGGIWAGPVPKPRRTVSLYVNGRLAGGSGGAGSGGGGLPPAAAPWAAPSAALPTGLTTSVCPSTGPNEWWAHVGCNLKMNWPYVTTGPVTSPHCWRGRLFEALSWRGGAPPETALSEAGRAALTLSLLSKYKLTCAPLLPAEGVVARPGAPTSACTGGAVHGDECQLACAPGHVRLRGSANSTCSAPGSWSGSPLVCAPAPPPGACAQGAVPLPAYAASCSVLAVNETWGGGGRARRRGRAPGSLAL